jgi:hypothetical protein
MVSELDSVWENGIHLPLSIQSRHWNCTKEGPIEIIRHHTFHSAPSSMSKRCDRYVPVFVGPSAPDCILHVRTNELRIKRYMYSTYTSYPASSFKTFQSPVSSLANPHVPILPCRLWLWVPLGNYHQGQGRLPWQ